MKEVQIGKIIKICDYCFAKKWYDETPGLCCAAGKIVLEKPPDFIKNLILETLYFK